MKKIGLLTSFPLVLAGTVAAHAQVSCNPNLTESQILNTFSDNAGPGTITPATMRNFVCSVYSATLPVSGGTLTGKLTTSTPTVSGAGLNLSQGVTPTSPINGDIWITASGIYIQAGNTTIGPLISNNTGSFLALSGGTMAGNIAMAGNTISNLNLSNAAGHVSLDLLASNNLSDVPNPPVAANNINVTPYTTSVATLRGLTAGISSLEQTRGYTVSGDGGASLYAWNPTSTCVDDGGSCIEPTSAPVSGRWIAQFTTADIRQFGAQCNTNTDYTTQLQNALNWAMSSFPNGGLFSPSSCIIKHSSGLTANASFKLVGGGMGGLNAGTYALGQLSSAAVWQFSGNSAATTLASAYAGSGATTLLLHACPANFLTNDLIAVGPDANSNFYFTHALTCSAGVMTIPAFLYTATAGITGTLMSVTNLTSGYPFVSPGDVITGSGVTSGTTITGWIVSGSGTGYGNIGTYNVNNSQSVVAGTAITATMPSLASGIAVTDLVSSPVQLNIIASASGQTLFGGEISNIVFDGGIAASMSVKISTESNWKFEFAQTRDLYFGLQIDDANGGPSGFNRIPFDLYQHAGNGLSWASGGLYENGCISDSGVTETAIGQVVLASYGADGIKLCNVDGTIIQQAQGNVHFATGGGSGSAARNNVINYMSGTVEFEANTFGNIVKSATEEFPINNDLCGSAVWGDSTALKQNTIYTNLAPAVWPTGQMRLCGQLVLGSTSAPRDFGGTLGTLSSGVTTYIGAGGCVDTNVNNCLFSAVSSGVVTYISLLTRNEAGSGITLTATVLDRTTSQTLATCTTGANSFACQASAAGSFALNDFIVTTITPNGGASSPGYGAISFQSTTP